MTPLRLAPPVLLVALALLAPAAAGAGYRPGDPPPPVCGGSVFADRVGTAGADALAAADRPERVYGLQGVDRLRGGPSRAACLFGGLDPDLLQLGPGGGIALGEDGADIVVGSEKDDALAGGPGPDVLVGRSGRDVLRGDTGIDAFDSGPGDDAIVARDRRRELVACGPGTDAVTADAFDVAFGCERVRRASGRRLPRIAATPSRAGRRGVFRISFRVPRGGGPGIYAVIAERCAQEAPVAVTVLPAPGRRVRTGQRVRVGLRPPAGGWCRGVRPAALVRVPDCDAGLCLGVPPQEPLARLALRVR